MLQGFQTLLFSTLNYFFIYHYIILNYITVALCLAINHVIYFQTFVFTFKFTGKADLLKRGAFWLL